MRILKLCTDLSFIARYVGFGDLGQSELVVAVDSQGVVDRVVLLVLRHDEGRRHGPRIHRGDHLAEVVRAVDAYAVQDRRGVNCNQSELRNVRLTQQMSKRRATRQDCTFISPLKGALHNQPTLVDTKQLP